MEETLKEYSVKKYAKVVDLEGLKVACPEAHAQIIENDKQYPLTSYGYSSPEYMFGQPEGSESWFVIGDGAPIAWLPKSKMWSLIEYSTDEEFEELGIEENTDYEE